VADYREFIEQAETAGDAGKDSHGVVLGGLTLPLLLGLGGALALRRRLRPAPDSP
jgi:LPXTG-motif cell wall-anchored protein